jgi:hypothetical protein
MILVQCCQVTQNGGRHGISDNCAVMAERSQGLDGYAKRHKSRWGEDIKIAGFEALPAQQNTSTSGYSLLPQPVSRVGVDDGIHTEDQYLPGTGST